MGSVDPLVSLNTGLVVLFLLAELIFHVTFGVNQAALARPTGRWSSVHPQWIVPHPRYLDGYYVVIWYY